MSDKFYQVYIDPKADHKLSCHMTFLSKVNTAAALRLYNAYEKALLFIRQSPQSCPVYYPDESSIDSELKYWLFAKRYRIVFEIIGDAIFVYDIQDSRQSYDKNFI